MTDNNVINFPRLGFTLTPTNTPGTTVIEPPNTPNPAPAPTPNNGSRTGRRSPLDTLAALPSPGIREPVIPTPAATDPAPGMVPAAFRSDNGDDNPHGDLIGPRIGALSLAAILAVAVAALRGAHTVTSTWWERRQASYAENAQLREARLKHQLAMQNIGDKAAQQRAKRIPSSHDFGRKTLNRSGGGRSSGSSRSGSLLSGSGSGRKNGSKTSPGGSSGSSRTKGGLLGGGSRSGKTNGGSKSPGNNGLGRGSSSTGRNPKPKTPKAPHRTSQGGGAGLKKAGGKQHAPTRSNSKGNGGRSSSLTGALKKNAQKAAQRRLNQRRKNGPDKPALWSSSRKTTPTPKRSTKKPNPNQKTTSAPDQEMWRKLKKAAARRWQKRHKPGQDTPPAWTATSSKQRKQKTSGPTNAKQSKNSAGTSTKGRNTDWWTRARDYARKHGTTHDRYGRRGPTTGTGPTPGASHTRGTRRSPFENAAQTAPTTWTVERVDQPGTQAKKWEHAPLAPGPAALDAAPTPHTARPGTTRAKEPIAMPATPVPARPDPRITKARLQAARAANTMVGRHMDDQHATEITLDDALDEYDDFTADAFKTSDQCVRLAGRARKLRDTLAAFADDLAVNHNLIGPLFSSAMVRMAESMDLVARMAEEMETSSIQAAEQAETANNDLNDAYRPITQATADAGLTTPSAPIHNQT